MDHYSQLSHQQLLVELRNLQSDSMPGQTPDDDHRQLLHELQVHQVELEIQNRELREAQQQLEDSRQRYRSLYELAPVGYLQLDGDGRIHSINSGGVALLDQPVAMLTGRYFSDWLTNTADRQRFQDHLRKIITEPGQTRQLELVIQSQDQQPRCVLVVSQAPAKSSPSWECLTVLVDITDRVRATALEHDIQHDSLTGLANRKLLMQRLELALQRAERHDDFKFAVLFVDLNRFKAINDNLGHQVGDQVLIALSEQLQHFVRRMDLAARLGGDEFVILLENISGLHQAVQIAERITETLRKPLRLLSGQDLFVSASIGIASSSTRHNSAAELLSDADIAMYRAKHHTRETIQIFDADMRGEAMERLQLEQELRQALEGDNGLIVYFQPIVELASSRVREVEALVRWQHPRHGLLQPGAFIGMAEETGLVVPLSEWVMRQACQQLRDWQARFASTRDMAVSVNISALQYKDPDFLQRLTLIVEQTGLPGQCLNLELSERHPIHDTRWFVGLLERLDDLGVTLSIDDVGTGYSSLSHLTRYALKHLKHLKIDTSFITNIDDQGQHGEIAQTIIGLARQLDLEVVAEGIETPAQRNFLCQAGCALGQGKLLSPPQPAKMLETMLAREADRVTGVQ